ncbi:hypothetical protein [Streptomyces corynorhini]|uniref:Uncharacterized protein n=1 Tax=Streptomyces corynorhini TaxID=2282652 RepID=A0A370BDZ5_9ACTN|nr:hypothetical protein [Streptomyces corynorhini]RDG37936.1 hypothetical protein DVH02_11475 [Streptomyces corynorhini]
MTTDQGADERRVAHQLRRLGVGPDATQPPVIPPMPAYAPTVPDAIGATDWVDQILAASRADRQPTTASVPAKPAPPAPAPAAPSPDEDGQEPEQPSDEPQDEEDEEPAAQAADGDAQPQATEPLSVVVEIREGADEAAAELIADQEQRRRIANVAYNGAAAGVGWWTGALPWATGRIAHYGAADPRNGVVIGLGLIAVCLVIEWRTHHWRRPGRPALAWLFGWLARVPLATAALALALYDAPLH